jgi:hypothetical protein
MYRVVPKIDACPAQRCTVTRSFVFNERSTTRKPKRVRTRRHWEIELAARYLL